MENETGLNYFELPQKTIPLFKKKWTPIYLEYGKIHVEGSGVKWINSSGLGVLMAGMTTLKNANGQMKLANVTEKVESLLMITQLMRIFDTYDTVDRAVAVMTESQ